MAEKVVINSSRVVQEVSIVSQPNITKVYINNNGGGGANFNLDVSEFGDAPINNVNSIVFEGAVVTDLGSRAVKVQITGASGVWGSISGILSAQTDLQNALNAKENLSNKATTLSSPDNTKYPTTLAIQNALDSINFNFDPAVDEVGTITPTNAAIDTGQSVQDGFSNAQGQIEDLYQRNPYQITQKFNLAPFPPDGWSANVPEASWDNFKVIFDSINQNLITPSVNNPVEVSFDLWWESFDGINPTIIQLLFEVSTNGGSSFTTLETYTSVELTTSPQTFTVDLSSYSNQYELLFMFRKTDGTINAIYLDNFNLKYELPIAQFASDIASINFDLEAVLENEILESGLVWQVPNIDGSYGTGTGSQYLRLNNAPVTQNALIAANTFGLSCGVLSTTASAGGIAFVRRNDAINLALYDNVETVRDFTVDSAITSGCRYFTGWSKNFQFSAPTNIEPDLQTECILVAKLSTSNNLQILHNDNAGTCTAIALGANFPANSNLYKYRVILQRISATNYNIQVIRKTLSNGALLLSTNYNLTTNLPTSGGVFQSIHFITNNADATDMRLGDYGLIVKKIAL